MQPYIGTSGGIDMNYQLPQVAGTNITYIVMLK
jgi:hypothetical protein